MRVVALGELLRLQTGRPLAADDEDVDELSDVLLEIVHQVGLEVVHGEGLRVAPEHLLGEDHVGLLGVILHPEDDARPEDLVGGLVDLGVAPLLDDALDDRLYLGLQLLDEGLDDAVGRLLRQAFPGRIGLEMADDLLEDAALAKLRGLGQEFAPLVDGDDIDLLVILEGAEDPSPVRLEVEGAEDFEEVLEIVDDVFAVDGLEFGLVGEAALGKARVEFLEQEVIVEVDQVDEGEEGVVGVVDLSALLAVEDDEEGGEVALGLVLDLGEGKRLGALGDIGIGEVLRELALVGREEALDHEGAKRPGGGGASQEQLGGRGELVDGVEELRHPGEGFLSLGLVEFVAGARKLLGDRAKHLLLLGLAVSDARKDGE